MEMHSSSRNTSEQKAAKSITGRQKEYLEAYQQTGSAAKAARLLGVGEESAREALRRVAKTLGKNSIRELIDEAKSPVANTRATAKELMQLLKQQEYRCALSGEKLKPKRAEVDHKIARAKGGSDRIENLQWLTKEINRMKGQMSNEEFIAACRRVVQWAS